MYILLWPAGHIAGPEAEVAAEERRAEEPSEQRPGHRADPQDQRKHFFQIVSPSRRNISVCSSGYVFSYINQHRVRLVASCWFLSLGWTQWQVQHYKYAFQEAQYEQQLVDVKLKAGLCTISQQVRAAFTQPVLFTSAYE